MLKNKKKNYCNLYFIPQGPSIQFGTINSIFTVRKQRALAQAIVFTEVAFHKSQINTEGISDFDQLDLCS